MRYPSSLAMPVDLGKLPDSSVLHADIYEEEY